MLRLWLSDFDRFRFDFLEQNLISIFFALVDPRFKKVSFDTNQRRQRAIEAILSAMQRDTVASATATAPVSTANAIQWAASLSISSTLDSGVRAAATH